MGSTSSRSTSAEEPSARLATGDGDDVAGDRSAYNIWSIRTIDGGSDGIEFARAKLGPSEHSVLVHDPPSRMRVDVLANGAELIARGSELRAEEGKPIVMLRRDGLQVMSEGLWPEEEHIGMPVILPGGEAGRLLEWEVSAGGRAWRWRVEFLGGPDSEKLQRTS